MADKKPQQSGCNCTSKQKKVSIALSVVFLILAAIALLAGFLAPRPQAPIPTINLVVQSSDTKKTWMVAMETAFNVANLSTSSGAPIRVTVYHTGSPFIAAVKPHIWSPSNYNWVNDQQVLWQNSSVSFGITQCKSTLLAPTAICMWRSMARALGWPREPITWKLLADLALDPLGWGRYDKPQWGTFKLAHGHPAYSNSGRLSLVSQIQAFADVSHNQTVSLTEVQANQTYQYILALESKVAFIGPRDSELLDSMLAGGFPGSIHAMPTYESNVVRWNLEKGNQMPYNPSISSDEAFVTIYPANGTYWETHPICPLLNAPWLAEGMEFSNEEIVEASSIFINFITSLDSQQVLPRYNLRPVAIPLPQDDTTIPISLANGALPWMTPQEVPQLTHPSPAVLEAIIALWQSVKRPARVFLAFDSSAGINNMNPYGANYFSQIKSAVLSLITNLGDRDTLDLYTFSSTSYRLATPGPMSTHRQGFIDAVNNLGPSGYTALYYGAVDAIEALKTQRTLDLAANETYTYVTILISDGIDTASDLTINEVVGHFPFSTAGIIVSSIAYGPRSDTRLFANIATRTAGKVYKPTGNYLDDVSDVLGLIGALF